MYFRSQVSIMEIFGECMTAIGTGYVLGFKKNGSVASLVDFKTLSRKVGRHICYSEMNY